MMDISVSVTIKRPVDEVFAFVSDLANDPAWHTDFLEVRKTSDGPIGVGTTFHVRFKPFMGISEGDVHVLAFEPNRRQVMRGEMGAMKPTVTYVCQATDGSTRYTRKIQLETSGLMRLMQPFMRLMMKRQNAGFLANLKRRLEHPSSKMEPS